MMKLLRSPTGTAGFFLLALSMMMEVASLSAAASIEDDERIRSLVQDRTGPVAGSIKLCGPPLRELLSLICDGEYAETTKRSGHSTEEEFTDKENHNSFEDLDNWNSYMLMEEYQKLKQNYYPSWKASPLAAMISKHPHSSSNSQGDKEHFRRNVRGVVTECCRTSCSYSELRAYCSSRG